MTNLVIDPAHEQLTELAEEYQQQGYEVQIYPRADELPDFLHEYQPDMVVHKDGQSIVFEVKTRQAFARNRKLQEMARVLKETDNWQLNLVVIGGGEDGFYLESSLDESEVVQGLEDARALIQNGYTTAALLTAWSSLEATLRLLGANEEPPIVQSTPLQLLQALVMEGVISRGDYEFLHQAMQDRNAVAHGYKPLQNVEKIVMQLIETTFRLLHDAHLPPL